MFESKTSLFFSILVFMSNRNFVLNWVKHDTFFITSGPDVSSQVSVQSDIWFGCVKKLCPQSRPISSVIVWNICVNLFKIWTRWFRCHSKQKQKFMHNTDVSNCTTYAGQRLITKDSALSKKCSDELITPKSRLFHIKIPKSKIYKNKANSTNLYPPTKGYLRETCKSQNINPIYLTLSSPTVSFRS